MQLVATRWFLSKVADNRSEASLAHRARAARMAFFLRLLEAVPRPARILDVGGTEAFWTSLVPGLDRRRDLEIVLLNVRPPAAHLPNVESVRGDAREMRGFATGEFDVVFSNSVIEHVGEPAAQRRMAAEILRLGRRYFVQTPNFWFPLEPHFLLPYFQLLPMRVRAALIHRFDLGWIPRRHDRADAEAVARSIRLLTRRRLSALFPDATIVPERAFGLTKSWIAYGGF